MPRRSKKNCRSAEKPLDILAAARYILLSGYAAVRQSEINSNGRSSRQGGKMSDKTKDIQDDLKESAHKIWLAGLGAFAMAEEEGGKFLKNLVNKGEDVEARGKEKVEKAKDAVSGVKTVAESYWETFERTVDDRITSVLHRIGVPTKDEIQTLTSKVEDLTTSIENLRKADAVPAPRKTAKAKTTAKAEK